MFSNLLIGIFAGLGSAAWIYSKMIRRTGGNVQQALLFSAIGGAIVLLLAVILLGIFF